MFSNRPNIVVFAILVALTLSVLVAKKVKFPSRVRGYLHYLWALFLIFTLSESVSFKAAIWLLAVFCFVALREYFSLVDIRLQDRWAIWGAYLSIPFMIWFIRIDWYSMFIISIPVYAFLVIPFLVSLGGKETEGSVLSIGAIDLGLFLFVYCVGHIGYLAGYNTWMAIALIANVAICDLVAYLLGGKGAPPWKDHVVAYCAAAPLTVILCLILSGWTTIPTKHSIALGLLIPLLVRIGRHTIQCIESDLKITPERTLPGRGGILDSVASSVYAAPVVFHYIRYFLT